MAQVSHSGTEHDAVIPTLWPRSVVCGVDGTAASREAVRQAAELAGPRGLLELVAVTPAAGHAPFLPSAAVATRVLAEVERIARGFGAAVTTSAHTAASAAEALIRASASADLLVVGCDTLGRVPTAVLRRASCSVLLARRPPDLPLCNLILVSAGDEPAAHLAGAQVALDHGSELHTVQPACIATAAAAIGAGLIVTADDGMAAQIARAASCSVLVVRERR